MAALGHAGLERFDRGRRAEQGDNVVPVELAGVLEVGKFEEEILLDRRSARAEQAGEGEKHDEQRAGGEESKEEGAGRRLGLAQEARARGGFSLGVHCNSIATVDSQSLGDVTVGYFVASNIVPGEK
jgi:hypothetical protein